MSRHEVEAWHHVGPLEAIPRGSKRSFLVGGVKIIVCRIYSELFAVSEICPHLGESMEAGRLQEFELICPHHGACFDIRDGHPVSGPAVTPATTYPCREQDGEVYVQLATQ